MYLVNDFKHLVRKVDLVQKITDHHIFAQRLIYSLWERDNFTSTGRLNQTNVNTGRNGKLQEISFEHKPR